MEVQQGFIKLRNISDKDAVFMHGSVEYEVKKGETGIFEQEIAEHGIRKTIVQEDWVTGEFNSQLVVDDGSYDNVEELNTKVLSSDPHATESVKVDVSPPGAIQQIKKNELPPSPKVDTPASKIQQPANLNSGGSSAKSK